MDEFELIDIIKQQSYRQSSLIKGIGDDAAIFRSEGYDVVTAVDTFVENVHFSKQTMGALDLGYRVLAVNISDLAAMGATPKFYLVSIAIPKHMTEAEIVSIFKGMEELASTYQMDLIGGDTVMGDTLTVSVTVIGYVSRNKARYRHDAREDDLVFVTGTLGDASCGLYLLMNELDSEGKEYLVKRHRRPSPRVQFANDLHPIQRIAFNDISDGLANELHEIARASQVSIVIEDEKIPISSQLGQFSKKQQDEWKYFGGEDFELVGTVSQEQWDKIVAVGKEHDLAVTAIGYVTKKGRHQVLVQENDKVKALKKAGFIHKK